MIPQIIGKYRVMKRLGKGGMGTVYKAVHPEIGKVVAVKLLQPSEAMEITVGSERLEAIFLAEAQILAGIRHANLMPVWDFDRDEDGRPFFVMDYICDNLGSMIGETFLLEQPTRPIVPDKVIHYGIQLLDALGYIHHQHIVHRDVKPHNVLVTDDDTVKLCDFGMALVDGLSFSGPENMQIGSPYYTPPEQSKAPHQVDGRADCFSAAVLLYRMLTGTLPGMQSFPLSLINPAYDHHWDDFFHTGLQWDPKLRFQSAADMRAALAELSSTSSAATEKPVALDQGCQPVTLRSTPENLCGRRALERFGLTPLARPQNQIRNSFIRDGDVLTDRATGLAWRYRASPYPLSWEAAVSFCAGIATDRSGQPWRLPTVSELLSLLDQTPLPHRSPDLPADGACFWSCDRHGRTECWLVNLDMGFAAPQDRDCPAYVRPVHSVLMTIDETGD